jgi:putative transposase
VTFQGGGKTWFSAADLADLALTGLPKAKRKINELAEARGWAFKVDRAGMALARPRAGRGGGMEYHVSLLPPSATTDLVRRGLLQPAVADPSVVVLKPAVDQLWAWFERQSETTQEDARRRLRAVDAIEAIEATGQTRTAAVASVSAAHGVKPSTLWNWLALIAGVSPHDRLPRLAPRRVGGGAEAEIDPEIVRTFKSLYLRRETPSWASCYERLKEAFPGVELPHLKTLQRRIEREVDPRVVLRERQGAEAVRLTVPPQQRSVADLQAMELVNIDGHKWDVFVRFPAANGEPERIARPMMVAIQDVMSRKFLAWRIGATESAVQTRLAFADLFKKWGIPEGCLLDNGRAFASKWITGGAATRFRFTIRPEDPVGLLTSLGIKTHWATPYRGQSKPIERGFRDLCDHGAKHPAFAGAYTGNKPDAKPENYGSRAIDLADFKRVVDRIMAAHNAKLGRRTEMARNLAPGGGSFDAAFDLSYSQHPIRRATPEQLRMALLAAEKVTADRLSGAITFYGNRYWTEELHAVAGSKVVVRFDPEDLHSEVHVYTMDGRFVVSAPVQMAVGFLDVEAAKARSRQEAELKKAVRRAAELEDLLSPDQLAAMLPDDAPEEEAPSPNVIRPVRMRGSAQAAPQRAALIDRLDFEELAPARVDRSALRLVE